MIYVIERVKPFYEFTFCREEEISLLNGNKELVLIQHGFLGAIKRYEMLGKYFEYEGYDVLINQLHTSRIPLDIVLDDFHKVMKKIDFTKYEKVHLIGHSLGCAMIRDYLSKNTIPNLQSVILMGGPNIKLDTYKPGFLTFVADIIPTTRPLQDLKQYASTISPIKNHPKPNIGIVSGDRPINPMSKYIPSPNDGLVSVEMTKLENEKIKDELIIHTNHFEMYRHKEYFKNFLNFIKHGRFK